MPLDRHREEVAALRGRVSALEEELQTGTAGEEPDKDKEGVEEEGRGEDTAEGGSPTHPSRSSVREV